MRTTPPCVLESMSVMPFTVRLNVGCTVFQTTFVFFEELLFALDEDEDFAEEDFTEELLTALLEELFFDDEDDFALELGTIEELEGTRELLDFTLEELATELLDFAELLDTTCAELLDFAELLDTTCAELLDFAELLDTTCAELLDFAELLDATNEEELAE